MKPLHIETPLLESLALSQLTGKKIYLKMDALQPSGSFKIRGIGRLCQKAVAEGKRHFIASSGGNAGLAVAYAGRKLGVPVTVYLPETTTLQVQECLKMEGAEVIVYGQVVDDVHDIAIERAKAPDCEYIHPFDNPVIWEGHETLIEEIVKQGIKPDAVVLSVGGGGLLCGVAAALEKVGWRDVKIIAVETEGAASYKAAIDQHHPVTIPEINTIATTLGAKRVAEQAFFWSKKHPILSSIVTDKMAVNACLHFADDHRVLVEPACGAALAVIYEQQAILADFSSLLVVVCGGVNVSLEKLQNWKNQYQCL